MINKMWTCKRHATESSFHVPPALSFRMPSHFRSKLNAFLAPLLRTLGMSSNSPHLYFEFQELSNSREVTFYRFHLLLRYEEEELDGLGRMKDLRITELRMMKQMYTFPQHEYLLAAIMTPDGIMQWISLERHPGDFGKRASQSDSGLISNQSRSSLSSQFS